MAASLRAQVLWAPLLTVAALAAALAVEVRSHQRMAGRIESLTSQRTELEHGLMRLLDRHDRTMRRAREAVLDPRLGNRIAILSWSSEHYTAEMERFLLDVSGALGRVETPGHGARLAPDMQRVAAELTRLRPTMSELAAGLAALLEAVSADDVDAVTLAMQEIDRADRDVDGGLRRAGAMLRRAFDLQARELAAARGPLPLPLWVALALWLPLAGWLTYRPLGRLARTAALGGFDASASSEEQQLAARDAARREEVSALEASLAQRTRDADRLTQATRRAEHELALFRLYDENLINSLRAAVVVTDVGLTITNVNRAARDLLEVAPEPPSSLEAHPLLTALLGRRAKLREDLERAAFGNELLRVEGVPFRRSGRELLLDVAVAPYRDESGAARGFIWVCDDVTEAVQTKSQLLAAERLAAVGRLSAQVAHEIRNPLSAIALNAELLHDDFAPSLPEPQRTEARALLSAITAEIERLTGVTEGYLHMARLPRPSLRTADLNQLVGDLCAMLNEEMRAHHIEVLLDLASPAPHAVVDPGQLRQGMLNIIRNSREAMPAGGTLRIRTAQQSGTATIEIADDGPGIPDEVRSRVFEPFFSTKPEGTGLGLSLTRQILDEHGGAIEVAPGAPTGTIVRLSLPTAAAGAEIGAPAID